MSNLAELRKRIGLTQAELAARVGMNRERLVYAEQGLRLKPEEEAKILAVIQQAAEENHAIISVLLGAGR